MKTLVVKHSVVKHHYRLLSLTLLFMVSLIVFVFTQGLSMQILSAQQLPGSMFPPSAQPISAQPISAPPATVNSAVAPSAAVKPIRWETDFDAAVQRAEREQRPLFLHFVSNDSASALQMEREVFVQPQIVSQLDASFVMVRVNAVENPALVQRFAVTNIPTDVVLKANGQLIHRRVGVISAERFTDYLAFLHKTIQSDAMATDRRPTSAPPVNVAAQQTQGTQTQGTQTQGTQTQETQTQGAHSTPHFVPDGFTQQSFGQPFGQPFGQTMPQPQPMTPQPMAMEANAPHNAAPQNTAPNVAVFPYAAPDVAPNASLNASPNTALNQSLAQHQPAAHQPAMHQPAAPVAPTATSAFPASPSVAAMPAATSMEKPTVTPSMGEPMGEMEGTKRMVEVPLALEGFCPVALCTEERWVSGNPAYCTLYQGQILRFSSMEALITFAQNPPNYTPVAMGEDVVLMVDKQRRVNGDRNFVVEYNGRIFLFSSQETLNAFADRAKYYAEIALKYEIARREQPTPIVY